MNYAAWSYDLTSKLLHWMMAILLIGLVGLGWYMGSIPDKPDRGWYIGIHKSFGIIAGVLILLRIIWRLSHKSASLPNSIPLWQAKLSGFIHFLLYVCMILMPLSGFLGSSFGKYGVAFFGWQIPDWVVKNKEISKQLFEIHDITTWVLVALVTLHILAALKHIFINKNGVMRRMWFNS